MKQWSLTCTKKNREDNAVFKIVFESVQQKHLDKTIFDQQIVNCVQKTSTVFIYGL